MNSKELDDVLETAITNNDFKAIPHLIKSGANPNAISSDHSYSLLSQAIINDKIKCAKALLDNGANPNEPIPLSGNTATHTLAFHLYSFGKLMKEADKWVELFLSHNSDFNKVSENQLKITPLEKFSDEAKEVYERVVSSYPAQKTNKPKI